LYTYNIENEVEIEGASTWVAIEPRFIADDPTPFLYLREPILQWTVHYEFGLVVQVTNTVDTLEVFPQAGVAEDKTKLWYEGLAETDLSAAFNIYNISSATNGGILSTTFAIDLIFNEGEILDVGSYIDRWVQMRFMLQWTSAGAGTGSSNRAIGYAPALVFKGELYETPTPTAPPTNTIAGNTPTPSKSPSPSPTATLTPTQPPVRCIVVSCEFTASH